MVFDVRGELYDGLATVEAVKVKGGLNIKFIGLDVLNETEDRFMVQGDMSMQGDDSQLEVDQIRDLLFLNKSSKKK